MLKAISAGIETWLDQTIASAEKREADIALRRAEYLEMVRQHRAPMGAASEPTVHPDRQDHNAK
ncbi:hypothetical protein [Methylobacterium sp. 77]|uniref:hypothetical protein n=1 Tax=Methylobacterium sp. 77 TaxID=1101192 RepID=UPI0012DCCD48|nr:hypothetical protein [Methylobacterium sp. 77]